MQINRTSSPHCHPRVKDEDNLTTTAEFLAYLAGASRGTHGAAEKPIGVMVQGLRHTARRNQGRGRGSTQGRTTITRARRDDSWLPT